jgi:hypothetical protein
VITARDSALGVVTRAMDESTGELFLILGGIGAGKTTFLKRYRRTVGRELLDSKSIWFNVDFLKAPLDSSELESFVLTEILTQLRERYVSPHLETRRNIKRVDCAYRGCGSNGVSGPTRRVWGPAGEVP